ncbi:MAG: sensor histidine kinase [Anaerolineales bacterium]|nr:sensor histidine kinase [Anaerolineales bacterium]
MTHKKHSLKNYIPLILPIYLTIGAVALISLTSLGPESPFWLLAGLFVALSIVTWFFPHDDRPLRDKIVFLGLETIIITLLIVFGDATAIFAVLFFITSAQAMMALPGYSGLYWIAVLFLIAVTGFVIDEGFISGIGSSLIYATGYIFFGIFGQATIQADEERNRSQALLEELQEAHRQLQDYVLRVEELAVAEERNRLAREMHDSLGHRLTVASVQLEGAQYLIPEDPQRAAQKVEVVRGQVQEALGELRQTVAQLREPLEASLSITQALQRLIASFEAASDLTVNVILAEDIPPLPDSHRLALYRSAQEALTNVQRHAKADNVWLQLTFQDGAVSLLVSDDGVGLPEGAEQAGFGLRGMRERMGLVGGTLLLEPRPGGGTQLRVEVPLPVEESDA